jgi:hypothetical protein
LRTTSPDNSDGDEELTEPQPVFRNRRTTRRAPPRSKKPSDDWRRLVNPPVRSPNSKKLSINLKIITTLNEEPDKPVVEPVNTDIEEMDVDDVDEVNDAELIWRMRPTKTCPSKMTKHNPPKMLEPGEVDDEPAEGKVEGDDDQEQDLETNEVKNEQENANENENEEEEEEEEIEEEHLPDGDLEDQEIELQPAH